MSERPTVTSREAVLASMLAHACLIIYVLLFPDTFRPGELRPAPAGDANRPVLVDFVVQPPREEPPELALGDAGERTVSEPRPRTAPPATSEQPYSEGNTPNRFVAPRIARNAAPSPEPSPAAQQPGPPALSREPGDTGEGSGASAPPGGETPLGGDRSHGGLLVPPRGKGTGSSLREALGRMSTGMSGGAPLKYDNPAGGLSGPLGGLSFDTPGFDWGPYARKIYWVIWTNWTQGWPPAAWAGLKGIVTVRFRIWRDGRITDITIIDPSGTPAFDTCATLALEASSPLPPLPDDFPGESEGITARFLYNTNATQP